MKTIKIMIHVCFLLVIANTVKAQQFPYASAFTDTKHIWNPAFTATGDEMIGSVYFRQQWLGIGTKKAPRLMFASIQYPFRKQNMSLGGALYSDKAGPITNNSVVINYSYKLKSLLFRYDQLSIGIKARGTQFSFNATEEIYREGGDPLLLVNRNSKFYPAAGAGFSYISNQREYQGNSFFAGLAFMQAVSTNLLIQNNDFARQLHLFGHIGTKLYNRASFWELSASVNYTAPQLLDIILTANYDYNDSFWAGLSYSTVNDLFFQSGFYVRDIGNNNSYMKIGVAGNLNVTKELVNAGPGFELILTYHTDLSY